MGLCDNGPAHNGVMKRRRAVRSLPRLPLDKLRMKRAGGDQFVATRLGNDAIFQRDDGVDVADMRSCGCAARRNWGSAAVRIGRRPASSWRRWRTHLRAATVFHRKIQQPLADGGVIGLAREFFAALGLLAKIGGLVRQLCGFPSVPSDT